MKIADYKGYIPPAFGPVYPDLGVKVGKLRNLARHDPAARREHGEAVLAAIRALNRTRCQRDATPVPRIAPCASGTWESDGYAILAAVNKQNAARVAAPAALPRDHWGKPDARKWQAECMSKYLDAMEAKQRGHLQIAA